MKTTHRRVDFRLRLVGSLIIGLLLAGGCVQFEHQTRNSEPHGIVTIVRTETKPSAFGEVICLDGLPVNSGQSYRVKPGSHVMLVAIVEMVDDTGRPVSVTLFNGDVLTKEPPANVYSARSGEVSATRRNPYDAMQPVTLILEDRRTRNTTRSLFVKAGWRYDLEGTHVTKRPIDELGP